MLPSFADRLRNAVATNHPIVAAGEEQFLDLGQVIKGINRNALKG